MPWTKGYDHNDATVTLIDESGTLVMLPRRLEVTLSIHTVRRLADTLNF